MHSFSADRRGGRADPPTLSSFATRIQSDQKRGAESIGRWYRRSCEHASDADRDQSTMDLTDSLCASLREADETVVPRSHGIGVFRTATHADGILVQPKRMDTPCGPVWRYRAV